MYGWLEPGGAFVNSFLTDTVLRTSYSNLQLVLGNGSNQQAALYISQNRTGIGCQPSQDKDTILAVNGNVLYTNGVSTYKSAFQNSNCSVQITNNNITLQNAIAKSLNSNNVDARIQAENGLALFNSLVSSNYYYPTTILSNISVLGINHTQVTIDDLLTDAYIMSFGSNIADDVYIDNLLMFQDSSNAYHVFQVLQKSYSDAGDCQLTTVMKSNYLSTSTQFSMPAGSNVISKATVLSSLIQSPTSLHTSYQKYFKTLQIINYGLSNIGSIQNAALNLDFKLQQEDIKDWRTFFVPKNYFHFRAQFDYLSVSAVPRHILRLATITQSRTSSGSIFHATFVAGNKLDDLSENDIYNTLKIGNTLYAFQLDANQPPGNISESNIVVGYGATSSGTALYVTSSLISKNTTNYVSQDGISLTYGLQILDNLDVPSVSQTKCHGLDTITIDGSTTYNVLEHTRAGNDLSVFVNVDGNIQDNMVVMRRSISTSYVGIPLQVINATGITPFTIEYTCVCSFPDYIQTIPNKLWAYVIDTYKNGMWALKVRSITNNGIILQLSAIDTRITAGYYNILDIPFITTKRVIYVIPFNFSTNASILRIGDPTCTTVIEMGLGVGTAALTERLTVDGTASCKGEFNIYPPESASSNNTPFKLSYDGEIASLNDSVKISNNAFTVRSNLEVSGILAFDNALQTSDERLKVNIAKRNPEKDLEALLNIDVNSYDYIHKPCKAPKSGVIAQQIKSVIPDAVYPVTDIIDISAWGLFANVSFEQHSLQARIISETPTEAEKLKHILSNSSNTSGTSTTKMSTQLLLKAPTFNTFVRATVNAVEQLPGNGALIIACSLDASVNIIDYKSNSSCIMQITSIEDIFYKVDYGYLFCMAMNSIKALHSLIGTCKVSQSSQTIT